MRILGCSPWRLLKCLFIRLHQQSCTVFFKWRCSSARERALNPWEAVSHEDGQKWKCSFSFQAGAVSVLLLKMPLCSFSLKFQVVSNFPIFHLEGYNICLKTVLMLLVVIKLSKCGMKKVVRKGSLLLYYLLLWTPIWHCLIQTSVDCPHRSRCHLWTYKT